MGSTKKYIYRATKRHLNIFDISNGLATRPLQRKVPLMFQNRGSIFLITSRESAAYPLYKSDVFIIGSLTVTGSPSLSVSVSNLCQFTTERAEIWSPGTFCADIWTYKISALYLLYFQSYSTFSDVLSDFH